MDLKARIWIAAALGMASAASQGAACEPLRARIESSIAASGVAHFTVKIVDAGAPNAGAKVVGTCNLGAQKILYLVRSSALDSEPAASASASAPATTRTQAPRPQQQPILTECKDGRVLLGADCR